MVMVWYHMNNKRHGLRIVYLNMLLQGVSLSFCCFKYAESIGDLAAYNQEAVFCKEVHYTINILIHKIEIYQCKTSSSTIVGGKASVVGYSLLFILSVSAFCTYCYDVYIF